jgi:hypothetical protein
MKCGKETYGDCKVMAIEEITTLNLGLVKLISNFPVIKQCEKYSTCEYRCGDNN